MTNRSEITPELVTEIVLNGEARKVDRLDLIEILESVDVTMDSKGVALAIDDQLVRKVDWESYVLHGGERIEIITAAQGG